MVCVPGGKRLSQFRRIRTSAPDVAYGGRLAKDRVARTVGKDRPRWTRRRRAELPA